MWSGPRNISTALLRSWGNRPDTFVCDEPLYAHYLLQTGLDHPGAEEVIHCHETDSSQVVHWLTCDVPDGKAIFYQKHMAHHLLPQVGREWLGQLTHAFLIRDPRAMLASLDKVFPNPGLADTGLPQQRIFVVTTTTVPGLTQVTQNVQAVERGVYRYPWQNLVDIRFTKRFTYGTTKFEPTVDVFNLFNNDAVTNAVTTVGSSLGRPSSIVMGRLFRVGGRIEF